MAERELPSHHLGTLWTIHNRGEQPLRKGEIGPLLKRGLVEPTGPRGQYGMTSYRNTEAGKAIARNVVLSEGQFRHDPASAPAAPPPIAATSDEVPPGHMRMKNGKILKIANR